MDDNGTTGDARPSHEGSGNLNTGARFIANDGSGVVAEKEIDPVDAFRWGCRLASLNLTGSTNRYGFICCDGRRL